MTNLLRLFMATPLVVAAVCALRDRGPARRLPEFDDFTKETNA